MADRRSGWHTILAAPLLIFLRSWARRRRMRTMRRVSDGVWLGNTPKNEKMLVAAGERGEDFLLGTCGRRKLLPPETGGELPPQVAGTGAHAAAAADGKEAGRVTGELDGGSGHDPVGETPAPEQHGGEGGESALPRRGSAKLKFAKVAPGTHAVAAPRRCASYPSIL